MSDGPMLGRFRVSTFVLSEARDTRVRRLDS